MPVPGVSARTSAHDALVKNCMADELKKKQEKGNGNATWQTLNTRGVHDERMLEAAETREVLATRASTPEPRTPKRESRAIFDKNEDADAEALDGIIELSGDESTDTTIVENPGAKRKRDNLSLSPEDGAGNPAGASERMVAARKKNRDNPELDFELLGGTGNEYTEQAETEMEGLASKEAAAAAEEENPSNGVTTPDRRARDTAASEGQSRGSGGTEYLDREICTGIEEATSDYETPEDLLNKAAANAAKIVDMAKRSKNIKGTFVKGFKMAAENLHDVAKELALRSGPDNARRLANDNIALKRELRVLRRKWEDQGKEIEELRAHIVNREFGLPPPRENGTPQRPTAVDEGNDRIAALLAGLEERLEARLEARFRELEGKIEHKRIPEGENRAQIEDPRLKKAPTGKATPRRTSHPDDATRETGNANAKVREESTPVASGSGLTNTFRRGKKPEMSEEEPRTPREEDEMATWSKVVGRRTKQATRTPENPQHNTRRIRAPNTAAVMLTTPAGSEEKEMAALIAEARGKINLTDLSITNIKTRKGFTGALILEIPGERRDEKADRLAEEIRRVVGDRLTVSRPTKMEDLRITRIEISATTAELQRALATVGECNPEEVKVGEIRRNKRGTGTAWIRCPAGAAKKIANADSIRVGWSTVGVTTLAARPARCFKCLETGHARNQCTSAADRSDRCFRCGGTHVAKTCRMPPKCPLCADLGRPNGHCLGAAACGAPPARNARGAARATNTGDAGGDAPPASDETPVHDGPAALAIDEGETEAELEEGERRMRTGTVTKSTGAETPTTSVVEQETLMNSGLAVQ